VGRRNGGIGEDGQVQEPELWPSGATGGESAPDGDQINALAPIGGGAFESWERRSARICLKRRPIGFHYEVDGARGELVGEGWRLTASAAKRAARRQVRRMQPSTPER
jgi:hypothetical protein